MKLRRLKIENVRSFLEPQELHLDGNIAIIIGPNGGGKTNLLDIASIILRKFLLTPWSTNNVTENGIKVQAFVRNNALENVVFKKHNLGLNRDQNIEIDIEITETDIENIQNIKNNHADLLEKSKNIYTGIPLSLSNEWDTDSLIAGSVYTYKIINGSIQVREDVNAEVFLQYLSIYDIYDELNKYFNKESLSISMVTLPVIRTISGLPSSIILQQQNDRDQRNSVDTAHSKSIGSVFGLALGRLAKKHREIERDFGNLENEFYNDPVIKKLSTILANVGYRWHMKCVDSDINQYDIILEKQNISFSLEDASSGEKEFLSYLFCIYGLGIKNALIIIDEPELHLHPRWQKALLVIFGELVKETGNQFLLATHSPAFISPISIEYVSRIYSEEQQSKIIRLNNKNLPNPKSLFNIVNSQNSEIMFFADKVILVEGISDRIFFEKIFENFGISQENRMTYEIISVGGKGFFSQYETLLKECKVPYAIVTDLDYANSAGPSEVKELFKPDEKDIKQAITDKKSMDGKSFYQQMEKFIESKDAADIQPIWDYIKHRNSKLRKEITSEDQKVLDAYIEKQRKNNIFILSLGELEDYFPEQYNTKDIEKVIEFVNLPDFWEHLSDGSKKDILTILNGITGNKKYQEKANEVIVS